MTVRADLSYDTTLNERRFDLFIPDAVDRPTLIVMIHGGGWISGTRSDYHDEAVWFCERGYACACVGYRLAPLSTFPAAVADIQTFLDFVSRGGLEINVGPVVTLGNSAGGHLAAMAGLAPTNLETGLATRRSDGFVSIAPITDVRNPTESQYPIAMSFLEQFMGATHYERADIYEQASPVCFVEESSPPSLIVHGDADDVVPCDQSRSLYASLCQAGASSELHILPRQGHSFTLDAWSHIRGLTLDFLSTL